MAREATPTWLKLLATLAGALCLAFAVSVLPGVREGEVAFWDTCVYDAVSVVATLVCLGRAVVRPQERVAWVAIGIALLTSTAGDITWSILAAVGEPGTPSLADVPWIGFYPLAYAGLVMATRARVPKANAGSWLDGLVSGLALASVVAALAWDTIADGATGSTLTVVTALAYPFGDLLLMILVVGAFALSGWRPDRGLLLIGAGLLVWGAADTIYLFETARDTYVTGGPLDLLWPVGMTLMALGALQRSAVRERAPHWTGVALPTLAACAAGGVLVLSALGSGHDLAVVLAAGAVLAGAARTVVGLRASYALAATRTLAHTDELTGLPNRRALSARLEAAIAANEPFGVVVLDLDRFKAINDTLGHAAGDEVLRRLAPRLAEQLRPDDLLGRLGGDEFALVVAGARDERGVHTIAERLTAALEQPVAIAAQSVQLGASFGIALHPDDAATVHGLLDHADAAMYRAKREPRRHAELYHAMLAGELELHVQPIVDPHTGEPAAAEALLRWRHPVRGLLAAGAFLPAVADVQLQRHITDFVVNRATKLHNALHLPIAVHLTPADLTDDTLSERLALATGLELEVSAVADPERAADLLERTGLPVTLEAAGDVPLRALELLPVTRLKLDAALAASDAVQALARAYGAQVCAGRVETHDALARLTDGGVDRVQGYAIAAPMPPELLRNWAGPALVA